MKHHIVQTVQVGRYTLVEIETSEGIKAVGVARRTQGDHNRPEVGINIATSRALQSANKKSKKQKLHDPMMG